MENIEWILYAFDNQNEENPKICVKDVYGNWIMFIKSADEFILSNIEEHKPVEFKHPLRITKQEVKDGDYQFLCNYTIDFLEIIDTIDNIEDQKNKIIYEVKTMRMLLNNHWRICDIQNYGIIILSTELDKTIEIK